MIIKLLKITILSLILIAVTACGGGGSGSGTVAPSTSGASVVGFAKTSATFTQYEVLEIVTDECHAYWGVFTNDDVYIENTQYLNSTTAIVDLPEAYGPGQHSIIATVYDICNTSGIDDFLQVKLSFEIQAPITVANPELFLDTKIREVITLIDDMLLTVTDQQVINVLNEQRVILSAELNNITTQDAAITQKTAGIWANNEGTVNIPVAGILDPDRAAWIVGSSILFVGGFATGNPVVMGAGLVGLIYNYNKFITDYDLASENIYENIILSLDGNGDAGYEVVPDPIPAGVTILSGSSVLFARDISNSLSIKKTSIIGAADKTAISDVKSSIARLLSFLPDSIVNAIAAMSTEDKVEIISDLSTYIVSSPSDVRLNSQIMNVTEISNGANEIVILIGEEVGSAIAEDSIPFTFSINDGQGHSLQLSAIYYTDIPPPVVNDINFWYDFRFGVLIKADVGVYPATNDNILDVKYAETLELIDAPQYMLPYDATNLLDVFTGNGVAESESYLYIDNYSSFNLQFPEGGVINDSIRYRAHNTAGISRVGTINITSKYKSQADTVPLDLTTRIQNEQYINIPIAGTEGWLNPNYSVELRISPSSTLGYLVELSVINTATGATLFNQNNLNEVTLKLYDDTGSLIHLQANSNFGPYDISRLSNGAQSFSQAIYGYATLQDIQNIRSVKLNQAFYYCVVPEVIRGYTPACLVN